ncbi:ParB/RepB/Spo0J family partition protein [Clostridiaceae bacterium]|nr:ParB/RepB/Spo0J family partition protein [Clostridiaceae bacterium]
MPLSQLHPFEGHPFKVLDDDAMAETVDSIRQMGVANPLIVRPDPDGGYEIIPGHRRHHAAELAGLDTIPVIVRELDDDAAVIMMVDSNLQRENILPSERAKAYKMKMDALRHQGQRTDLTSPQVASKFRADDEVGKGVGVSGDTVRRFVRLTNLIPEVLDMVDEKKIAFNPAVELSYLKPEEQRNFLEAMDYAQAAPSVSQAQRMKKKSQESGCTLEDMCGIMDEVKKDDMGQIAFKTSDLQKFFPKSYTPRQMSDTILRLLEQWQRRRQRDQQR